MGDAINANAMRVDATRHERKLGTKDTTSHDPTPDKLSADSAR